MPCFYNKYPCSHWSPGSCSQFTNPEMFTLVCLLAVWPSLCPGSFSLARHSSSPFLPHWYQAQYLNLFPRSWLRFCLFWVWSDVLFAVSEMYLTINSWGLTRNRTIELWFFFFQRCLKQTANMKIFLLYSFCFTKIQVIWKNIFKWEVSGKSEQKHYCH